MLHADIIYLPYRGQKYATLKSTLSYNNYCFQIILTVCTPKYLPKIWWLWCWHISTITCTKFNIYVYMQVIYFNMQCTCINVDKRLMMKYRGRHYSCWSLRNTFQYDLKYTTRFWWFLNSTFLSCFVFLLLDPLIMDTEMNDNLSIS